MTGWVSEPEAALLDAEGHQSPFPVADLRANHGFQPAADGGLELRNAIRDGGVTLVRYETVAKEAQ